MNFFHRQAEAQRLSHLLLLLFVLAIFVVIVIVTCATCLLMLFFFPSTRNELLLAPSFGGVISSHWGVVCVTTLIVLGTIASASSYRMLQLRAGGSAVAQSLGAVRISTSTIDQLERQLLNVVEEMSIASGLPVPDVYLLAAETGINTFSAGHNPANAAIIVTRGALDRLDRTELQGVIAHEFSHILNGDMELNIRMMGPLHGLMFVSFAVRTLMGTGGLAAFPVLLFGSVVVFVGYVGLFFGRLIQAAISRRREWLADAMAVQLTRDPSGLEGALMKVMAIPFGSYLHHPRAETVAHMLFAQGTILSFDTHPAVADRIKALDPAFNEAMIDTLRSRLTAKRSGVPPDKRLHASRLDDWSSTPLTNTSTVDLVGNPGAEHLLFAHKLGLKTPVSILMAAQQASSARALLLALALHYETDSNREDLRQRQIRFISLQLSPGIANAVAGLWDDVTQLDHEQKLPALLRVFPALRRLPFDELKQLLICLALLLQREGISPYLYTLRKLAQVHLIDDVQPRAHRRTLTLRSMRQELQVLFSVLAHHGNADPIAARRAFDAGMTHLFPKVTWRYDLPISWPSVLDVALDRLDQLAPLAKEQLVEALEKTILNDERLLLGEAELLRMVCAVLHCPLPPLLPLES